MQRKTIMFTTLISVFVLTLIGFFIWSIMGSRAEQVKYSVVYVQNDIEIRDYSPLIVAQVEIAGERKQAISAGFRILADYIFGNNTSRAQIAMTAPVTQQESEKIAMTAPVTQEYNDGKWRVRFTMPSHYDLASLPRPNNPAIKIEIISAKRFVVIRFAGIATDELLAIKLKKLEEFMQQEKITKISDPTYAFFNPPWTLPFMRRTEVMLEVTKNHTN